jgi:integrase
MAVRLGMEEWVGFEETATNPQDAAIVRLLLEGVSAEEIAGLTTKQIDADARTIVLMQRKGGIRHHPVSKTCIQLLQQALQQTYYPASLPDGTACDLKLARSEYVVRVTLWDHIGNEAFIQDPASVRLRTVYARLRKLSEQAPGFSEAAMEPSGVDLVS